jgi:hypothetical protein
MPRNKKAHKGAMPLLISKRTVTINYAMRGEQKAPIHGHDPTRIGKIETRGK